MVVLVVGAAGYVAINEGEIFQTTAETASTARIADDFRETDPSNVATPAAIALALLAALLLTVAATHTRINRSVAKARMPNYQYPTSRNTSSFIVRT